MNTMGLDAFNTLLMSLFSGIGQQQPQLGPDQGTTITQPDGLQYTERPVDPAEASRRRLEASSGTLQNLPASLESAIMAEPGVTPMPLESNIQESLQPQVVEAPPEAPQESPQPPDQFTGASPELLQSLLAEPPKSESGGAQTSDTPVYDEVSKMLLDELKNDKVNWGRAAGLAAIAYDNPQLALSIWQADENKKERLKSYLLQASGQEMSLKRSTEAQKSMNERSIQAAKDRELAADERARKLTRAQANKQASDAGVDISDLDWSPENWENAVAEAQSRISLGTQFKALGEYATKKGIPTEDIDFSKPTPEGLKILKSRVDDYDDDLRAQAKAVQIASSSPTGITPQTIESMTKGIKDPNIKLETITALEAAAEEGRQRRAQTELARQNIESQIQDRAERRAAQKARDDARTATKTEVDNAKTFDQAEKAVDRAMDNLRQAQQNHQYWQSPATLNDVSLAQAELDRALRKRSQLEKEVNPYVGQEASTFNSIYSEYKYPEPNKPEVKNEWGMSGDEFDNFIFDPKKQDDPQWAEIFESMWRDFDAQNNNLGDPTKFILSFNNQASAWASAKTKTNRFFNQPPLNLPPAAVSPQWLDNPPLAPGASPTPEAP